VKILFIYSIPWFCGLGFCDFQEFSLALHEFFTFLFLLFCLGFLQL